METNYSLRCSRHPSKASLDRIQPQHIVNLEAWRRRHLVRRLLGSWTRGLACVKYLLRYIHRRLAVPGEVEGQSWRGEVVAELPR